MTKSLRLPRHKAELGLSFQFLGACDACDKQRIEEHMAKVIQKKLDLGRNRALESKMRGSAPLDGGARSLLLLVDCSEGCRASISKSAIATGFEGGEPGDPSTSYADVDISWAFFGL